MRFSFNTSDTSSVGSADIRTTAPLSITQIVLRGTNPQDNDVNITLTIRDGTNTVTYTETAPAQGEFEVSFGVSFISTQDSTINLSTRAYGITIYGGSTRDAERMLAGAGAYISSSNMFNCDITASVTETYWTIGASGYAELVQNPLKPWTDWERDEDGYPLNASVWRIDSKKNKGFPYIIPPIEIEDSNSIFVFSDTELLVGRSFVFTEDDLIPVQIIALSTLGE